MEQSTVLQQLEKLADDLSINVRYEIFEGQGGLCRYDDRLQVILNRNLDVVQRIELLSKALSRFPLDGLFVLPHLRQLLGGENP